VIDQSPDITDATLSTSDVTRAESTPANDLADDNSANRQKRKKTSVVFFDSSHEPVKKRPAPRKSTPKPDTVVDHGTNSTEALLASQPATVLPEIPAVIESDQFSSLRSVWQWVREVIDAYHLTDSTATAAIELSVTQELDIKLAEEQARLKNRYYSLLEHQQFLTQQDQEERHHRRSESEHLSKDALSLVTAAEAAVSTYVTDVTESKTRPARVTKPADAVRSLALPTTESTKLWRDLSRTAETGLNALVSKDSVLTKIGIRDIFCLPVFQSLPQSSQDALLAMLPQCDQSVEGLVELFEQNPWFDQSVYEYQDFLVKGDFDPDMKDYKAYLKGKKEREQRDVWKQQNQEEYWGDKLTIKGARSRSARVQPIQYQPSSAAVLGNCILDFASDELLGIKRAEPSEPVVLESSVAEPLVVVPIDVPKPRKRPNVDRADAKSTKSRSRRDVVEPSSEPVDDELETSVQSGLAVAASALQETFSAWSAWEIDRWCRVRERELLQSIIRELQQRAERLKKQLEKLESRRGTSSESSIPVVDAVMGSLDAAIDPIQLLKYSRNFVAHHPQLCWPPGQSSSLIEPEALLAALNKDAPRKRSRAADSAGTPTAETTAESIKNEDDEPAANEDEYLDSVHVDPLCVFFQTI
jgi:hypothetical protein